MSAFTDDWKQVLENFQNSVTKDLEEIRQHKAEVQALRQEIQKEIRQGLYYRDSQRLILSAPEVIIGNVDETCMLLPGYSTVTLRGNEVNLQGVGSGGSVHTRASSIRQTAVDPGVDGKEEVVRGVSEVVSQATNIVLESHDASDVFSRLPRSAASGGIIIHADSQLQLEAAVTAEQQKAEVEGKIKSLEASKKSLETLIDDYKKNFQSLSEKVENLMDAQDALSQDEIGIRAVYNDLDEVQEQFTLWSQALAKITDNWVGAISSLAEVNRQIKVLNAEKSTITTGDNFKKKGTGARVSITGERIDLTSADGEGNLRDNEGSGINLTANEVTVKAIEADQSLKKKGSVSISAKTLNFNTINPSGQETDDKGVLKKGKYPVEGDVFIRSKNITMEAVDNEIEDGKPKETALTSKGKISMRAETMDFSATDTAGKATGSIGLNSKALNIRSMDVDKDSRADNKLAAGSTMLLLSEKMYVGASDNKNKSKNLQAVAEEMGLFADNTLEAQQGNGKAVMQLAGGDAALAGSKTQIYGETTINAKTEVKDELKAPKATIDNLEAKTSFKSSNISDGIAIPVPATPAKLSTKLKTEDAPKPKKQE